MAATKDILRISAKNLGALAMPNCCRKCFWLKLKLAFKLPYQIGFLYYEPQTDIIEITAGELGELVSSDSFLMGFGGHCLDVELKPREVVQPLLKEVRALWDMNEPHRGPQNTQEHAPRTLR